MHLADQLRTTTFLITLRYMVLLFVSVTILLGFINWKTISYLEGETERAIEADTRGLAELNRQTNVETVGQVIAARVRATPGNALYLLADRQFKPLVGNLEEWPELTTSENGWIQFEHTDSSGLSAPARARIFAPREGLWLLVGRRVPALERLDGLLDKTLFWGLGVTLALALATGLLMSESVLRRVNVINATSSQIMGGDLSQRISTRGTRDEFDQLAENLNAMLDQIESLMSSIQHISDNVAHDLRTPLTRLRNRLETLQRNASGEEAEHIEACLEDADALLSTFSSLLSIARIESGTSGSQTESMDISTICHDACDLYQALAEEKSIDLNWEISKSLQITGDKNLIFQALTNLLDNAIKYTPDGGRIDLRLWQDRNDIVLTISDSGTGIPEDMREKVLQRFYRLDKSRSAPGAGLGLSLVQAIALRHKARLTLEDNEPGLRVRMIFPAAKLTAA
jgi:signal transduction histidine kinase